MYKQNDWNWKRRVDPFPLIKVVGALKTRKNVGTANRCSWTKCIWQNKWGNYNFQMKYQWEWVNSPFPIPVKIFCSN
jgi:hypothetical protein